MGEETAAGSPGLDKVDEKSDIPQIAYCVKCKKKVLVLDQKEVTLKGGRLALQGFCPDCGTKVYRIMGKPRS